MRRAVLQQNLATRLGALGLCLLLGGALAACSNMSGTTAQQVREWSNGAGYSADNAQLNSDLQSLAAGKRLRDLRGLRTACAGFGVDAATLQGELPTPDTAITDEINNAMTSFYNASLSCYAASSFSSSSFRTYERELASGVALYDKARKQLAHDGVK